MMGTDKSQSMEYAEKQIVAGKLILSLNNGKKQIRNYQYFHN